MLELDSASSEKKEQNEKTKTEKSDSGSKSDNLKNTNKGHNPDDEL